MSTHSTIPTWYDPRNQGRWSLRWNVWEYPSGPVSSCLPGGRQSSDQASRTPTWNPMRTHPDAESTVRPEPPRTARSARPDSQPDRHTCTHDCWTDGRNGPNARQWKRAAPFPGSMDRVKYDLRPARRECRDRTAASKLLIARHANVPVWRSPTFERSHGWACECWQLRNDY